MSEFQNTCNDIQTSISGQKISKPTREAIKRHLITNPEFKKFHNYVDLIKISNNFASPVQRYQELFKSGYDQYKIQHIVANKNQTSQTSQTPQPPQPTQAPQAIPATQKTQTSTYKSKFTFFKSNDKYSKLDEDEEEKYEDEIDYKQRWDNPEFAAFAESFIESGKRIIITKYEGKSVMYMFILKLKLKDKQNRVLCKIGYSHDIQERIKSLRKDYDCVINLIAIKTVENEQREKRFHNSIREHRSELWISNLQINNKFKDEIYVFDQFLFDEFSQIKEFDKDLVKDENLDNLKNRVSELRKITEQMHKEIYNM